MHSFILPFFPPPSRPLRPVNFLNTVPLMDMPKAMHQRLHPPHRVEEMLAPYAAAWTPVSESLGRAVRHDDVYARWDGSVGAGWVERVFVAGIGECPVAEGGGVWGDVDGEVCAVAKIEGVGAFG